MDEKTFKKVKATGALNITMGAIIVVTGVATGVLLIISGAKLLAHKAENLF